MSSEGTAPGITVQLVLFHTPAERVVRTIRALARCAEHGWRDGRTSGFTVSIGDCSPAPMLDDGTLDALREELPSLYALRYEFFGENLGSGGGHNRLLAEVETEIVLTSNPDVVPDATAVSHLVARFADPTIAAVEAKQLPIEHPKRYDERTGDTSWVTTAFCAFRTEALRAVDGFDAEHFFLHGDDVDVSWRLRARGYRVVVQPSAVVFHDKRLRAREWESTSAERHHSLLSALMLRHRWSGVESAEALRDQMRSWDLEHVHAAVDEYERRAKDGRLPQPIADASVAEFVGDAYAEHRFAL